MITDQAERLRRLVNKNKQGLDLHMTKFIEDSFADKTFFIFIGDETEPLANSNVLANIAVAVTKRNKKVLIIDSQISELDPAIPLGIKVNFKLDSFLKEKVSMNDIIYKGESNVLFIKFGEIFSQLDKLDFVLKRKIFELWNYLADQADIFLINGYLPYFFSKATKVIFLVSNNTIASVYKKIKEFVNKESQIPLGLIVNLAVSQKEAINIADRLTNTVQKFLNKDLEYLGFIQFEPEINRALKQKTTLISKYPYSGSAENIRTIADKLLLIKKRGG